MRRRKNEHVAGADEVANDPSLRYFSYRMFECLWSDELKTNFRFGGYTEDGRVRVAEMNMHLTDATLDRLGVRRLTSKWTREEFIASGNK